MYTYPHKGYKCIPSHVGIPLVLTKTSWGSCCALESAMAGDARVAGLAAICGTAAEGYPAHGSISADNLGLH